jgi:hypothetical protein
MKANINIKYDTVRIKYRSNKLKYIRYVVHNIILVISLPMDYVVYWPYRISRENRRTGDTTIFPAQRSTYWSQLELRIICDRRRDFLVILFGIAGLYDCMENPVSNITDPRVIFWYFLFADPFASAFSALTCSFKEG